MAKAEVMRDLTTMLTARVKEIEESHLIKLVKQTKVTNLWLHYSWNIFPEAELTEKQFKTLKNIVSESLDRINEQ